MQKEERNEIVADIISQIKELLGDSEVVRKMFKRYGADIAEITDVDISFAPLPVSAKTKNEKIFINEDFLIDGSFIEQIHYVVHEMCHFLQQSMDDPFDLIPLDNMKYLDMPAELEAFAFQIAFQKEFYGEEFAKDYLDGLLDFHELEGTEREEKQNFLEVGIEVE